MLKLDLHHLKPFKFSHQLLPLQDNLVQICLQSDTDRLHEGCHSSHQCICQSVKQILFSWHECEKWENLSSSPPCTCHYFVDSVFQNQSNLHTSASAKVLNKFFSHGTSVKSRKIFLQVLLAPVIILLTVCFRISQINFPDKVKMRLLPSIRVPYCLAWKGKFIYILTSSSSVSWSKLIYKYGLIRFRMT